ncbi:hypothetical protein ABZT28_34150 [Streptomyces sp. NPDC005388]|uniref:hypothetical protein n=1 Tax=Streptomyces sp. NPDC005388 TaxID=3156717 RepID=UPI0033A27ACB
MIASRARVVDVGEAADIPQTVTYWLRPARMTLSARAPLHQARRAPAGPPAGAIGDLGFTGLDDDVDNPVVITGYKAARTKPLTSAKKQVNKLIASIRAVCAHSFAHMRCLAHHHQASTVGPLRDHPAAGTARPDQLRSRPLADDLGSR